MRQNVPVGGVNAASRNLDVSADPGADAAKLLQDRLIPLCRVHNVDYVCSQKAL